MAAMSISEFEAEIADLDKAAESKNFLVYGNSGAGKSHLTGALPKALLLAFEPGWETIRRIAKENSNPMRIVQIATAERLDAATRWLESGGWKDFEWIILDGLSTLQVKMTLNFAAVAHEANPAKRVSRNIPDRADYFNAQNAIKDFVARMIDLPVNTFWTAHAMTIERPDGTQEIWPLIEGKETKVSNYVSGLMHSVGYMAIKGSGRQILWGSIEHDGTTVMARDQFALLPKIHKNPTMQSVLDYIDGKGTPPSSKEN
jgi:hypothetical protein